MWEEKLALYDQLISKCPEIERKGKTMPYTSVNGHMFSQLNKDGELGIRFSEEVKAKYMQQLKTSPFKAYGAVMKGYILIPEKMWNDMNKLSTLLKESYSYVLGLEPK
ncbi:MAG: hypothetical protein IPM34_01750 [Saprospiraceae bacterium]|nr:hypothetical protein [Saprospiraceae bacterium]